MRRLSRAEIDALNTTLPAAIARELGATLAMTPPRQLPNRTGLDHTSTWSGEDPAWQRGRRLKAAKAAAKAASAAAWAKAEVAKAERAATLRDWHQRRDIRAFAEHYADRDPADRDITFDSGWVKIHPPRGKVTP